LVHLEHFAYPLRDFPYYHAFKEFAWFGVFLPLSLILVGWFKHAGWQFLVIASSITNWAFVWSVENVLYK